MSDETPWAGMPCRDCGETVLDTDDGTMTTVIDGGGGAHLAAMHRECQALGIIGHTWGVCSCNGWEHDRAAALELKRRIYEALDGGEIG